MVKRREIVEINLDKVNFPNRAVSEYKGHEIRIKGGIKGQKISARISRKKKNYLEAKIVEVLEKSPLETEEGCSHFGICGGCTYQTIAYEKELNYKKEQIENLFKDHDLDIKLLGIEASPRVEGYRNKMEYTFGDEYKDGPLSLGMHVRGRFYEIVSVEDCNIVDSDFSKILMNTLKYFQELKTNHYHKKTHRGLLRHFVVRKAASTGEILVNLVTSSQGQINKKEFVEMLNNLELEGEIKGILHTINDNLSDTVQADKLEKLYGRDFIVEEILGLKFKISPFSFFQTNTFGAEKLYSIVRDFVGDIEDLTVFDLYSGTGTIAQIMAPLAKKVIGIEIVEEAVEMARENAEINKLDNVEFIAGDVLQAVDQLEDQPDLIVIDPPRDGIHPKAINKIIDFDPKTFVYVSCNPITLVRDLKIFIEKGYRVEKAKLMDQFPRTPHVEVVTLLVK